MTIQQTERARELAPCPWCAGLNIEPDEEQMFCVDCEAVGPRVSFGEPRDRNERWNLRATPQTSEEVVEAVARAELPDDDEPKTWRELAEAAIADLRSYAFDEYAHRRLVSAEAYEERAKLLAAMPSIPQESDAEVTEAMESAGAHIIAMSSYAIIQKMPRGLAKHIYTAMTSARDRESQERGK